MERWEQFQGVYIHTPFCLRKCLYCDFPSYAGFPETVRQEYVDALCREIAFRSQERELPVADGATIYFGGGTPTVLTVDQIGQTVACLKRYGWWRNPAEATIEANPGTVDLEKLRVLRQLGFERISLGVQSLQDRELCALGRIHTAEQAVQAIEEAKQAGFRRISADLMSGIPCQTVRSFRNTLDRILQLNLSHVSVYSLILEEGTTLERLVASGQVELPDEETAYLMYEMTTDRLERAGLTRYEISNYAVPGEESFHNKVYWHYEPYAAFGAGACAFTGNGRRTNTADVPEYIAGWKAGELEAKIETEFNHKCAEPVMNSGFVPDAPLWETEELDRKTQISETMIMGLRMTEGVDLHKMQQRFGIDVLAYYREALQSLPEPQMLECVDGHLRLTPYGMRYGNRVFEIFV
ncbi:MAG: radical SAM family heme chaperone HemW [Acidaminococcaceae bacterium]|nr:radical SAM family heme chaperone HemW [Acidaminococcaceae bacterium]